VQVGEQNILIPTRHSVAARGGVRGAFHPGGTLQGAVFRTQHSKKYMRTR